MVPVNKKIIAAKAPGAPAPQKRRPRNTELNSSKKVSRLAAAVQNRCSSLNSSKSYDGYEYEDITVAQLAEESQVPVADLESVLKSLESEYGCNVTGILVSADREAEKEYDGKDIVVQTDCGDFYWGEDKFIPVNSSADLDMNCSDSDKSSEVGTVTIYNDFADLNVDEVETLIKDRVKEMSPNCSVSIEKLNDTELKISLSGTDEDITQGRLAVESSDVTKSVDWERSLDSGCHGEKMNSSEDSDEVNPSEKDAQILNSRRWDWDRWDEYGTPSEVTPEIQEAVNAELEDVDIVKVLIPKGNIKDYLLSRGIQALVFVQDSEDPGSYEEIVGWDGSGIVQDSFNLADIQDNALSSAPDLSSSTDRSVNCAGGESGTIYTESGNEVAITDIKVVQNPQTNALALFVPENGDDEIPEGFTVIATAAPDAAGTSEGEDSLNSSRKPPVNRAQRRAAQRGARRPKKR